VAVVSLAHVELESLRVAICHSVIHDDSVFAVDDGPQFVEQPLFDGIAHLLVLKAFLLDLLEIELDVQLLRHLLDLEKVVILCIFISER